MGYRKFVFESKTDRRGPGKVYGKQYSFPYRSEKLSHNTNLRELVNLYCDLIDFAVR